MKIEREDARGRNTFSGYGTGYVAVNGARHDRSIVVSAEQIVDWSARSVEALGEADMAPIVEMRPEIVLIGTGDTLRFPDSAVLATLYRARIGVEVMDTHAACRTYNILMGEGRKVVAALIV